MNAWLALTKKEFRLGLPAFLIALIIYIGIVAGGYLLGTRIGYEEELFIISLIVVVTLHLFFLIFYLYFSLNSERKRLHLWLHTPMPIGGLLLSKMVTGLAFMTLTFITSLTMSAIFFNKYFNIFIEQTIFNIMGISTFGIFFSGISITIIFIFFWTIFLTYSQRMNDFLSFILTFVLFLLLAYFHDIFTSLAFMETLTNWGPIQVKDIFVGFELSFAENVFETEAMSEASVFYIGHFIRDLIVIVLLYIAACWIIDKKVEV